ncbi:MAG: Holliday junction endonuclease [Clostridia bacterium]
MKKIFVGFDPGKTGALAAIREDGVCTTALPFPLSGDNELDLTELTKWLKILQEQGTVYAIIEKVHAMPGQGVTSMFSFGMTTGMLHGMLAALGIPRFLVSPQAWKKRILYDTAKDKNAAIEYCARVYPQISLLATPRSQKSHTGIADAVCIARYAYEVDKHG